MKVEKFMMHWDYFVMLERDFFETHRYVEHSVDNSSSYSSEFAKLILLTCSEIDVVCKTLCQEIDKGSKANRIDYYRKTIVKRYPSFDKNQVLFRNKLNIITPWEGWNENDQTTPQWWGIHNGIKHDRGANFKDANLINSLYSLSALLILLDHLKYFVEREALNEVVNLKSTYLKLGYSIK